MASILNVDTISGKTTADQVTVNVGAATQHIQAGLSKMFAAFDGGAASMFDSLNVDSFTDTSTGAYSVTFTNNFASTGYVQAVHSNNFHTIPSSGGHATSGFTFQTFTSGNSNGDCAYIGGTATGDLA